MAQASRIRAVRALVAVAGAVTVGGLGATPAHATDAYPCAGPTRVSWSSQPVQQCPLVGALPPHGWVPVYGHPAAAGPGHDAPPPVGWLHGTANQYFVCERSYPAAEYQHPQGWRNHWWAYTHADGSNAWGWVPEVYFRGGADDEPDAGLRECPPPPPPPKPPPRPAPPPPRAPQPPVQPAPQPCNAYPATPTMRVRASVAHSGRAVTTRYGRRVRVRGRLTYANGAPLAGATLCVVAHRRAGIRVIGAAHSNARGRFRFRLRAHVSRRVSIVYRAGPVAASTTVRLRVRAPLRMRASRHWVRNGGTVRFHGRLSGPPRRRGVLVELQARHGRRWQTFGTTSTRRHGRFRYRYRFQQSYGVHHYRFRARAPRQRGYPFAAGSSRAVGVRVIG